MAEHGEASSSSLSEGMFDAFLSFRGKDTRYRFTDHLYYRLAEKEKLQVFRDEPDLKMGDQVGSTLMEAIKRSRMFIVVVSENYVCSTWCLMELEEMLKYSNNGTKRPIFPIFYHVEPAEVRHQISQKSKKAMEDHERRVGVGKVKEWKLALSTLCGLSGQHIVANKGYETQVMGEIAEKVLAKHREMKQLLSRFDSQFDAVESLSNLESRNILGMVAIYDEDAKIDKTTFAFELYYKIKYEFKAASFLIDVSKKLREDANGLENLQKELLSDMGVEIISTMMGGTLETIKQMMQHRRVLLVLDGVDSQEHLELLAGEGAWFGPGSRIIITTEDKDLLHNYPVIDGAEIRTHCIREVELDGNRGSFTMMEENVVGLERNFHEVINQLKDEAGSPGNVVSIVGMGGLGKTTLARKVYNSNEAGQLFPTHRAWATISRKPILIQVFRNLLKCLKVPESEYEDSSDEEELKEKVRKCLKGKKYLVVLDDVWDTNNPWCALRGCFPTKNKGSMILVTTRDDRVANALESKIPHLTVTPMNEEESWKLFHNEVFYSTMCPPELEGIGRSIAESCNGLPLLIKTRAGIVAKRERSVEEWEQIKKVFPYWSIAEDKDGKKMMETLKFSYHDLSPEMKPRFLYLGVFPEDEEILARDLISMWIAEDFIKPIIQTRISEVASAIEAEEIGQEYLKELVDRNLVQVASRRSDGKGMKTVKIHDLIRELCISESNNPDNNSNNARRLSFLSNIGSYACLVTCNQSSTTRSLVVYGDVKGWPLHISDFQVNVLYLKRLRSMGLTTKGNADEYFKKVKSIRFLAMGFPTPHKLRKLQRLQTLHLFDTIYKFNVPEGLEQLRHLRCNGVHLEQVDDKMQNLQTLRYVYADSQIGFLLHKGYFANLTTLGLIISTDEAQSVEENFKSLHHLSKLSKLKLRLNTDKMVSLGRLAFPSSLTKITLRGFLGLKKDDMNALGQLPQLQILKLRDLECIRNLLHCGSDESFPKLQVFIAIGLKVKYVILERLAMPNLRRAVFRECHGLVLEHIPERMLSFGSNLRFEEPRGDIFYHFLLMMMRTRMMRRL